ncbi:MAG TPA: DUF3309 family protein [Stellaceae bacterium]|nr:DUF3309 family protein [Stellaceae bacterium]
MRAGAPLVAGPAGPAGPSRYAAAVLLTILLAMLVGALPLWPYSAGWGYYPSGGVGVLLVSVVVLALTGYV